METHEGDQIVRVAFHLTALPWLACERIARGSNLFRDFATERNLAGTATIATPTVA
jgi:hypothetical protein